MLNALHRFQMRVVFAAVFALLLAQLGAVAHGYSHDAAARPAATHQTGAGNHESCNDCVAYAAVLSAAGTPANSLAIAPAQLSMAFRLAAAALHDDLLLLAFRSRAPPNAR